MASSDQEHYTIKDRVLWLLETASAVALLAVEALLQQHADIANETLKRSQESQALSDGSYWNQQPQIMSMLLATVPCVGQNSRLKLFPKDVSKLIARFMRLPRLDARFSTATSGQVSLDGRRIEISVDEMMDTEITFERPLQYNYIQYAELELSFVHCGTSIIVHEAKLEIDLAPNGDSSYIVVNQQHVAHWDRVWQFELPNNSGDLDRLLEGNRCLALQWCQWPSCFSWRWLGVRGVDSCC